jgi:hypothetical protein
VRILRAAAVVLVVGVMSCELPPQRTGSCQPAVALAVGFFERGEAYHDDCSGPDEKGDFFTLSLASQASLVLAIEPEGSFAPKIAVYAGTPGDVNPPLVGRVTAYLDETLRVRVFLQPGDYFIVAGTQTRSRATYRITASTVVGADCSIWNFVSKGVQLAGFVNQFDCTTTSDEVFGESFELWRQASDSVTVTVVADSAGYFSFGESCCEYAIVRQQVMAAGDSITFGHRAPARVRPYRASFQRNVFVDGPGAYRLRID